MTDRNGPGTCSRIVRETLEFSHIRRIRLDRYVLRLSFVIARGAAGSVLGMALNSLLSTPLRRLKMAWSDSHRRLESCALQHPDGYNSCLIEIIIKQINE